MRNFFRRGGTPEHRTLKITQLEDRSHEWEVAEYRDMLVIIRDRVENLIKNGAGLDQVKAARVTADYDDRFGATSGAWTTDRFVEAVYATLKNPPKSSESEIVCEP